jgi:hypothetical protein
MTYCLETTILHPLVYELVDAFRKENKKMENTLVKLKAGIDYKKNGIEYKRKPEYVAQDGRIQNVVRMYNKVNFNELLGLNLEILIIFFFVWL